jgi:hypothetical protein
MSNNTLFAYLKGAISNSNDTDPEDSSAFVNPPMTAYHNVIYYRRETLDLDDGDTRSITFPETDAASGWVGVMCRVIGEAKLTTVGVNWDGSTALTGVTVGYGTDRHPGMISMVTKNVTSYTLECLADDSTLEYVAMILAEDDAL